MITPEAESPPLSLVGYMLFLAGAIVVCVAGSPTAVAIGFCLVCIYAGVYERQALKRMVRIPVLVFCLLLSASIWITPVFNTVDAIQTLESRIMISLLLLARLIILLVSVQIISTRIAVAELCSYLERLGMREFGFVLGIAIHMLPAVHRHARTSRDALKIRGAFRKNRVRAEYRWCATLMKWMLRQGDTICVAARVRGFGLTKTHPGPIRFRWYDLLPLIISIVLVSK